MTPTIEAAVSPFQAVSNRSETDKAIDNIKEFASVSLFQRFQGTLPGNNLNGNWLPIKKFREPTPPKP